MLHQFTATLSQIAHAGALLAILYGVMLLLGAMLSHGSPLGLAKGFIVILAGTWIAGLFPV